MAKAHYWSYIKDINGNPVSGVTVTVYDAGTTTQSYIFESESASASSNTTTLTTDSTGLFEFWIGDRTETNGYPAGSKFKISWEKNGYITSGYIDNVDIWIDKNKANIYREIVEVSHWFTDPGDGSKKCVEITHDLNEMYPLVVCYGDASQTSVSITVKYINSNITRVSVSPADALKSHITVIG